MKQVVKGPPKLIQLRGWCKISHWQCNTCTIEMSCWVLSHMVLNYGVAPHFCENKVFSLIFRQSWWKPSLSQRAPQHSGQWQQSGIRLNVKKIVEISSSWSPGHFWSSSLLSSTPFRFSFPSATPLAVQWGNLDFHSCGVGTLTYLDHLSYGHCDWWFALVTEHENSEKPQRFPSFQAIP